MSAVRRCVPALVLASLVACTSSPAPGDAAVDAGAICTDDASCDDGLFCNGIELCRPLAPNATPSGCVVPVEPRCASSQTCDEAADLCVTDCGVAADADGDGHASVLCASGDDCDDSDPLRFPGNIEICDDGNHDEDCDATTYGERNGDRDGSDDLRCCNVRDDDPTMLNCGEDCDDLRRVVNPDTTEACDRFDNDCDGAIDEGVFVGVYADADRDGVGAGAPMMRCADAVGYALEGDDCDDMDPSQRPGGPEICDARDNDCDGRVDEMATAVTWYRDADGDGFGSARTGTVTSCEPLTGFSLLGNDCDDTRRGRSPVANELCNGVDDDCNGVADFEVAPGDFEDDDADGFLDARCGAAGDDCDDANAATHAGATEVCDGRDNDCDGTSDDLTGMVAWYPDVDGDGWGDGSREAITSCTEPAGRVARALDCDDSDPERHPGHADLCDGAEEDCDAEIDEDAARTPYWMGDRDGDGYAGGVPTLSCSVIAGAATIGGDCDDDRVDLRPGASETCDGEDDDCDGSTDESLGTITCGMAECRREIAACTAGTANVCAPGASAPEVCNGRDEDCDGVADDEPAATASCALAGAVDQCRSGACAIVSCDAGVADCNSAAADGCEADLATDEANCGACGHACVGAAACVEGGCSGEIVQLALGGRHSCARTADGRAYCWGANDLGQLGANSMASLSPRALPVMFNQDAPVVVTNAVDLDAGVDAACILRRGSSRTMCWGDAVGMGVFGSAFAYFRAGYDQSPAIVEGPRLLEFTGRGHFVLDEVGHLWFGGDHIDGSGGVGGSGGDIGAYRASALGFTITEVSCGLRNCLARDASSSTGTLMWGGNYESQLGTLLGGSRGTPSPLAVGEWTAAALGNVHGCLIRPGGVVSCIGRNASGQVGDGTTIDAPAFVDLATLRAVAIDTHRDTTCAIDPSGGVWCWGENDFGQCGTPGPTDVLASSAVDLGGVRARLIEVGDRHACAVLETNQIACWGQGSLGQLGNASTANSATPVLVTGLP